MPKAINRRILRVDLNQGRTWTEEPDESLYRKFYGGRGFIAHFLLSETSPGVDPLGPENPLIFATGPLTGVSFPGNARYSVGAKSPLTGLYGEAESGGYLPAELKRAGWDAIIVKGRSAGPVYLWIHNDEVEIRDASGLWGKITGEVEDSIRDELGDARIRVAQIGPAGEHQVRFAAVMNDLNEAAGRTGMGAVMGSKNLKAVAVRGTGTVRTADPEVFRRMAKAVSEKLGTKYISLHDFGTGVDLKDTKHREGHLIVRNFRDGVMETVDRIDATAMHDTVVERMDHCYACSVRCKKRVRIENGVSVDPRYGGPEYEAIGALGSNLALDDIVALCKSNEMCNYYGLDAISTGNAIGWAMELYELGILNDQDTGGQALRWSSGEDVIAAVEAIAYRRGIGDLLAEGVLGASRKLGRGSERYAVHVKGLEVAMHDPRALSGFPHGLRKNYPVTPTGGDHMSAAHKRGGLVNTLGVCQFLGYEDLELVELVNAATGWDATVEELAQVFERGLTMTRLFNLREGMTAAADRLPDRMHQPLKYGPLSDKVIPRSEIAQIVRDYYVEHGWDSVTGVPKSETLEKLGIVELAAAGLPG